MYPSQIGVDFVVLVSYSDRESTTENIGLKAGKTTTAEIHDAILKVVGKKIKEGWTVINATANPSTAYSGFPIFYLKRKK